MGYGFACAGDGVVGFFDVDVEGVAFDFADGECGDFVIVGVEFEDCAGKVGGEVGPVEEHSGHGELFGASGGGAVVAKAGKEPQAVAGVVGR